MKKLKKTNEKAGLIEKTSEFQHEQELSIRELLEVQGGLDMDEFMRDCQDYQCNSAAVVSCETGAIKS